MKGQLTPYRDPEFRSCFSGTLKNLNFLASNLTSPTSKRSLKYVIKSLILEFPKDTQSTSVVRSRMENGKSEERTGPTQRTETGRVCPFMTISQMG